MAVINLKAVQPHKVGRDLKGLSMLLYAPPKAGKAISVNTSIPTPQGVKKAGDIKEGDLLFTEKGLTTQVIGVYPQGQQEVYEVHTKYGDVIKVNGDHIWTVWNNNELIDITTKEMYSKGVRKSDGIYSYRLPVADKIKSFSKEKESFYIHPYIIGAFIGDGCLREKALTLSSDDIFIVEKIAELLPNCEEIKRSCEKNYSWKFYKKDRMGRVIYHQTKEIFGFFPELFNKKSCEKTIPTEYLYSSLDNRINLLQGLFDTDGCVSKNGGVAMFSTTSKELAKQVKWLICSVGMRSSIKEDIRPNKGKITYNVRATGTRSQKSLLFSLPRKKERFLKKEDTKDFSKMSIVNIVKTGYKESQVCFYVDNPTHLFLVEDFIPTHNTYFASQVPKNLILATEKGWSARPNIMVQPIDTWGEFKQAVNQLKDLEVKEMFDVITIDTIDLLVSYCEKSVCANAGVANLGDIPYGKGYAEVRKNLDDALQKIVRLGYGLIMIGHSQEKVYHRDTPDEYTKIVPTLSEKNELIVSRLVDIITYIHSENDMEGNWNSQMFFRGTPRFEAGSRFKYMPFSTNASYGDMIEALGKAVDQEEAEVGSQFFTDKGENINNTVIELDFDELLDKFNKTIETIPGSSDPKMETEEGKKFMKWWQPRIKAIIENNIGMGKMIADITRNQVDSLNTIIMEVEDLIKNNQ